MFVYYYYYLNTLFSIMYIHRGIVVNHKYAPGPTCEYNFEPINLSWPKEFNKIVQ